MPYKNPADKRRYQRERVARQRAEWLHANGPCLKCGAWLDLQVDHIDPELKVSHNVWSWRRDRRDSELSKCQVLCRPCHLLKTREDREPEHGTESRYTSKIYRCRCAQCTAAMKEHKRVWRAKTGKTQTYYNKLIRT